MKSISVLAALALAACASSGGMAEPDAGIAATPAPAAPAPAAEPAAAAEVTVSRDQSNRGRNGFMASCTACHGSGEFSDSSFKRRWQGRTAGALFNYISTSMPEDAPGSLPAERYVDIVTYFMGLNGFSLGSAGIEMDQASLQTISLAPFSGN